MLSLFLVLIILISYHCIFFCRSANYQYWSKQKESIFEDSTKKQCKPVKNVIFLKTHKTGSSTIINIIQRFAHQNNLTVALPDKNHFLGWPNLFNESYIFEHSKYKTYNIICNHAIFHRERMLTIMESNDTKIITIIRDPLYQFESAAVYYGFRSIFKLNREINILDAFLVNQRKKSISKC